MYLVAIFAVEPASETTGLAGSLGRVAPDGDLDWHVEIIQLRRKLFEYTTGAAIAIVYLRIDEKEFSNVVDEEDVSRAFDLLEILIAPKEWQSRRPLSIRILDADNIRGDGKNLGGSVYANMIWNTGQGSLGADWLDWGLLDEHPALRFAIRFFTRGVQAADERFLPDACINYARALECLVGSAEQPKELKEECARLSIDAAQMIKFLRKTRGKYAIAHSLHVVKGPNRKFKELPTPEIERAARKLTEEAIEAFIRELPGLDHKRQLKKGLRYMGFPVVPTNLPLPREVLWQKMGPWDKAAPGLAPDSSLSLAAAARKYGIPERRLRRMIEDHLVRGHKDGSRWQVQDMSLEMLTSLRAETPRDVAGSTYTSIANAAEETEIPEAELRQLVKERYLPGSLRARQGMPPGMVEISSVRYYRWRRKRKQLRPKLYSRH